MNQACARWRGDIGACIVDALDQDGCARLRRHMRAGAACRADYEDLLPVRDWLSRLTTACELADHQADHGVIRLTGTPLRVRAK
jgi:hypothetical protein